MSSDVKLLQAQAQQKLLLGTDTETEVSSTFG